MKKGFSAVSDILEDVMKKKNSPLSGGYFICQLIRCWQELAGEEIAKTGRPVQFKNQELTLALPSSSHLNEMHFVKEALRHKINERFPDRKIKRIHLKVQSQSFIDEKWIDQILS